MKEEQVVVRIEPEHKLKLIEKAKAAGMNLSEYARILFLKDIGIIK